jgi:hypothetical protein
MLMLLIKIEKIVVIGGESDPKVAVCNKRKWKANLHSSVIPCGGFAWIFTSLRVHFPGQDDVIISRLSSIQHTNTTNRQM